jgi:hypothetical protein
MQVAINLPPTEPLKKQTDQAVLIEIWLIFLIVQYINRMDMSNRDNMMRVCFDQTTS